MTQCGGYCALLWGAQFETEFDVCLALHVCGSGTDMSMIKVRVFASCMKVHGRCTTFDLNRVRRCMQFSNVAMRVFRNCWSTGHLVY